MSADIPRQAQALNGGSRRPGPIAQTHQAAADLEQQQFEKQAQDYAAPTTTRPALIVAAEIDTIQQTYTTGQGRLAKLREVVNYREAVWQEGQGLSPFDVPTDDQRKKAGEFFAKYGVRLADEPRQAPPNPIRAKQESEKPAAAAPTPPAAAPKPTTPPAEVPGVAKGPAMLPPPASADVEFILEQGYRCTLHVQAPSWSGVLEQLGQVSARLAKMKAKPAPAAMAPVSGQAAAESADVPQCAIHHTPMQKRQGRNGSFWSCPQKLEDGSWCPYKPK